MFAVNLERFIHRCGAYNVARTAAIRTIKGKTLIHRAKKKQFHWFYYAKLFPHAPVQCRDAVVQSTYCQLFMTLTYAFLWLLLFSRDFGFVFRRLFLFEFARLHGNNNVCWILMENRSFTTTNNVLIWCSNALIYGIFPDFKHVFNTAN